MKMHWALIWLLIHLTSAKPMTNLKNECLEIIKKYEHAFEIDHTDKNTTDICEYIDAEDSKQILEDRTRENGVIEDNNRTVTDEKLTNPNDKGVANNKHLNIIVADQPHTISAPINRESQFTEQVNKKSKTFNHVDDSLKLTGRNKIEDTSKAVISSDDPNGNNEVSNVREVRKILLDHLLDYVIKMVRDDRFYDTNKNTNEKIPVENKLRNYYDPNYLENYITEDVNSTNVGETNDFYEVNNPKDDVSNMAVEDTVNTEDIIIRNANTAVNVTNLNLSENANTEAVISNENSTLFVIAPEINLDIQNIFENLKHFNAVPDDSTSTKEYFEEKPVRNEDTDDLNIITNKTSEQHIYRVTDDLSTEYSIKTIRYETAVDPNTLDNSNNIYNQLDSPFIELSTNKSYTNNDDEPMDKEQKTITKTIYQKAMDMFKNLIKDMFQVNETAVNVEPMKVYEFKSDGLNESYSGNYVKDSENVNNEMQTPNVQKNIEEITLNEAKCDKKFNMKIDLNVF